MVLVRRADRRSRQNGARPFQPWLESLEGRITPSFKSGYGAVVTRMTMRDDASALVLTFDGPLNATPANPVQSPTNPANYTVEVPQLEPTLVTSRSSSIAVTSATYTPDGANPQQGPSQVTLNLATPLSAGTFYRVFINGSSNVSNKVNPGLIDALNHPIDGDYDDTPSGNFYKLFGWAPAGQSLNFTDSFGDQVSLSLSGTGRLETWRELNGDFDAATLAVQVELPAGSIQQINVRNGVLGQTTLTGAAEFSQGRGTHNGVVISPISGEGLTFTNQLPSYFQYLPVPAPLPPPTPIVATPTNLPYKLVIEPVNYPDVPAVQSAVTAVDQVTGSPFAGYWLAFGGRSNGRHGFIENSPDNFPANGQNLDIIVINPRTGQTWTKKWNETNIPASMLPPLYSTNQQSVQQGDTLYTSGGYGFVVQEPQPIPVAYRTYDTLTALSVDGLIRAVVNGGNAVALSQIQQIHDLRFQITGGVMDFKGGLAYLIGGHDFQGNYKFNDPVPTQTYIDEIRSFKITYDPLVQNSLSISDYQAQNDQVSFRRRDFNYGHIRTPSVDSSPPTSESAFEVFGGVFLPGPQTDPFASAFRNQIGINFVGSTTITSYQQYFNQYTSPNIGLFDEGDGTMYNISLGGISLYAYDFATGQLTVPIGLTTPLSPGLAFVNDVVTLMRTANGTAQEFIMPSELPGLYGAEAAFFPNPDVPQFDNGVIQLNRLSSPVSLGYMYGGIFAPTPLGSTTSTATGAIFKITLVPTRGGTQTVGTFDPGTATWYLRNSNSGGDPNIDPFVYGGPGWIPVVGDWNGDGTTTVGVVDPATQTWYLRNENDAGDPSYTPFQYGAPGWIPVVGDWTGTGHTSIGVFDPSTSTWYLRTEIGAGNPDVGVFVYGAPGWIPVAGDWTGIGHAGIGVFDPTTANWYLRTEVNAGSPDANPGGVPFSYGGPGWKPVVGDWTGLGMTTIGVVDPSSETWYLRNSNSPGGPNITPFAYGGPGWNALAGHWEFPPLEQRAAGGEAAAGNVSPALTDAQLHQQVDAALARLAAASVSPAILGMLARLDFSVGNLPRGTLALSYVDNNRVMVDADAAGYGWFVDNTPARDEEFTTGGSTQRATRGSGASGRMDLLTVLLHEMGHFAGWTELDPTTHPDALMALTLGTGTRRTQDLDAVFSSAWITRQVVSE